MKEDIIPEWLNLSFLTSVLKQKYEDVEVTGFTTTPAVLGGNNYCSRMWRVNVTCKDGKNDIKSTSLMVKAPLPDGTQKRNLEKLKFVEKECRFYNEIVPKIYQIAERVEVVPKTYYSSVSETIVLEDLKEEGYEMCDRLKQLDFNHCRVLMKTLATFHAFSVAVAKVDPELVADVGKEHLFYVGNKNSESFDLHEKCLNAFSQAIKKWDGFDRFEYITKDKIKKFVKKLTEIFTPSRGFSVLNHGDLWTNNILFKYDEDGNVTNAKLVDLQNCKLASPGVDLNFFIWSSIQEDVLDNRMEELKAIYLDSLNRKLEELGCEERLSKNELEEDIEFTRFFGFFMLTYMLPFLLADPDDHIYSKMEDILIKEEILITLYDGKFYKTFASKILPKLENSIYSVFCNN